ncbi:hypothetical protein E2R56_06505 [Rhodococcus qingshengii]|nr:hypothetical protein E2R56_06505 [Rhodococcus qingshengii]
MPVQEITNCYGCKGVEDIRARNYGNKIFVDISIFVNSNLDVKDGHEIASMVEDKLIKDHSVYDVVVHVKPK